jgi:hypothetical protein
MRSRIDVDRGSPAPAPGPACAMAVEVDTIVNQSNRVGRMPNVLPERAR